MTAIPQDILDWYEDFRWWTRAEVFSNPQCAKLVPSVPTVIAELRKVYDADACRNMVLNDAGALVSGLFLGNAFSPAVDDMLQLGTDLALCDRWDQRPKFVGALRSLRGWAGARFEAGVNAGLRRVGLTPIAEPTSKKSDVTPDFLVDVDGLRIALELKGLRDPDYERNRSAVCDVLGDYLLLRHQNWRIDVTLHLNDESVRRLEVQHDQFVRDVLPSITSELVVVLNGIQPNQKVTLPSLGELVIAYPPLLAGEHFAGAYSVSPGGLAPDHLLRRALRTARECCKQLGSVRSDVRIAILWGGRMTLPAADAARAAEETIEDEYHRWSATPLDWIVFFNGHTLGHGGRWTIDLGTCRVSPHAAAIPPKLLEGIARWGNGRNA